MPKRKPTPIKALEGNRGRRPLNTQEPAFSPKMPPMPEGMSPKAQEIWNHLGPRLVEAGTLCEADSAIFSVYCQACADLQKFNAEMQKEALITTPNGHRQASPYKQLRKEAIEQVRRFGAELGIGSANRSKIRVSERPRKKKDNLFTPPLGTK